MDGVNFMLTNNITTSLRAVNQKILASCAYRMIDEDLDWLGKVKSRFALNQGIAEPAIKGKSAVVCEATFDLVEYIFDCLTHHAVKFNESADLGFSINFTAATLVSELNPHSNNYRMRMQSSMRGRLTARDWTLVVRSNHDTVEFLLVPVSKILTLSRQNDEFKPFIILVAELDNEQQICLRYGNDNVDVAHLLSICKSAFQALINRICEPESESAAERILHSSNEEPDELNRFVKPNENKQVDKSFESLDELFYEIASRQAANSNSSSLTLGISTESATALALNSSNPCLKLSDAMKLSDDAESCEFECEKDEPSSALRSSLEKADSFIEKVQEISVEKSRLLAVLNSVTEQLEQLRDDEERNLRRIVSSGAVAFESNDFERVERLLREANLRRQSLQILRTMVWQWSEISNFDHLIGAAEEMGVEFELKTFDVRPLKDDACIRVNLEILLSACSDFGARAFSALKLDGVERAYKLIVQLKSFCKKFCELYPDYSDLDSAQSFALDAA